MGHAHLEGGESCAQVGRVSPSTIASPTWKCNSGSTIYRVLRMVCLFFETLTLSEVHLHGLPSLGL
jgi:hypothetical protein